jgi:hypothetical protein
MKIIKFSQKTSFIVIIIAYFIYKYGMKLIRYDNRFGYLLVITAIIIFFLALFNMVVNVYNKHK